MEQVMSCPRRDMSGRGLEDRTGKSAHYVTHIARTQRPNRGLVFEGLERMGAAVV